jgi:hypothetical protein
MPGCLESARRIGHGVSGVSGWGAFCRTLPEVDSLFQLLPVTTALRSFLIPYTHHHGAYRDPSLHPSYPLALRYGPLILPFERWTGSSSAKGKLRRKSWGFSCFPTDPPNTLIHRSHAARFTLPSVLGPPQHCQHPSHPSILSEIIISIIVGTSWGRD